MKNKVSISDEKRGNVLNPIIIKRAILPLVVLMLIHITYISPMQSDDFEFASYHFHNLSKIIKYSLFYGNGRLLGNIGACILNNNIILRAIVKVIMIIMFIILIPKVLEIKNQNLEYMIYFLILGMAPEMFGQTIVWTSGFQNYIPPIIFMFICICICKFYSGKRYQLLCIGVFGFISQMYVEHCTMIHIMVALLYFIYYMKRQDVKKSCSAIWLVSTVLGAICMFLIPKVFYIENNRTKGYRAVHLKGSTDLIYTIKGNLFTLLNTYSKCVFLWIAFCILGIFLLRVVRKSMLDRVMTVIYFCYPVILIVDQFTNWTGFLRHLCVFGGMCLCFILTIINVLRLTHNRIKAVLFMYAMFSVLSVGPLLIITPFGERNVLLSYVFLVLFVVQGLDYVLTQINKKINNKLTVMFCLFVVVGIICLDAIFINVKKYDDIRQDYIIKCMKRGDKTIDIFEFPSRYMFPTYLISQYYYYEHRGDIKFILRNYDEWKDVIENE